MHFYSTILLVKCSTKLIIHGHFLLLQVAAQQHCFGVLGCLARGHLDANIRRPQTPCYASQTHPQAPELGFSGNKAWDHYITFWRRHWSSQVCWRELPHFFPLPYLPTFGSQLGPFEELFYLIKNKLIES